MRVVTIVGNPVTPSRTRVAADQFSDILRELGGDITTVDLALLSIDGLAHGNPEPPAQEALDAVLSAELILVVTPIYKASFTGLLKILLDGLPHESLRGKVAIPVIVGSWPGHSLVLDHALKPVFSALGATCPARGLLVIDKTIDKEASSVSPEVAAEFRTIAKEAVCLAGALRAPEA